MKEYAERFYKSKSWQKTRAAYVKMRGGLCERCLKEGRISAGVIVHHKIYLTPENIRHPEITLNFENLELLCREHHQQEHDGRQRRYKVDELGRVIV